MGRERKQWQRGRDSWGCIYFLWSYIICLKSVGVFCLLLCLCSIQLINCTSLSSPPLPPLLLLFFLCLLLGCLHQMRLGDRPYLRPRSSAVTLIYGSITPQLVQTEAHSSLIRELQLWSWALRQHVRERRARGACVSLLTLGLIFCALLCSPNMEPNGDESENSQLVFELLLVVH